MNSPSLMEDQGKRLQRIFLHNPECFDCSAPSPKWASINHGVLLCIRCAGIHRSLGVHISKVRSLTMDKLDPNDIELLERIGNSRGKQIFEAKINANFEKPSRSTSHHQLEKIIRLKWEQKAFTLPHWEEILANRIENKVSYQVKTSPPVCIKEAELSSTDFLEFPLKISPNSSHLFALKESRKSDPEKSTALVNAIVSAFDSPLS